MSISRSPGIRMDIGTFRATSFGGAEPDYIDGILEARQVGDKRHSQLVMLLIKKFLKTKFEPLAEVRFRITPTRLRNADLAILTPLIYSRKDPHDELTEAASVIEVLSLGQSAQSLEIGRLFQDYASLKIPSLHLLDPHKKRCWYWDGATLRIADYGYRLVVSHPDVRSQADISTADLWEALA